ncbi:DUF3261 domain-containing protein [Acinetobacter piscicola]|uniref:DUF3261 domain-containing protein n=1 Tax=Acinetobacter piscicola TaxID=2006115 RepID=UPI000B7FAE6C|nr:DUF3261 domain-containing protein [Acinetobacter piscicola]
MLNKWKHCALAILLILPLTACQQMLPKAQGLANSQWIAQHYQRQDLVEVQWKAHSFSFLLYQQQQDKNLDLLALSLTGQQLFKLGFDGTKVKVEQRIDQMKLLPFDFLVRDILFATYPNFIAYPPKDVQVENTQPDHSTRIQNILIHQNKVLTIRHTQDHIELDNVQVPYQMVFSEVPNTLENNE